MAYKHTFSVSKKMVSLFGKRSSAFWVEIGKKRTIELFKNVAAYVPAYKDFLKKHGVNAAHIKTWNDFQSVPIISKQNYLRQYPLEKLCWNGTLKNPFVFTATSGSTGEPFYFPRERNILDLEYSFILEHFLDQSSYTKNGPTLVIICFGMGVWIGGLITYNAFALAAERGQKSVSVITPGINKKEIFQALRVLSPQFRETILVGYPPFMKDLLDEGEKEGISWGKLSVRFLFAAEAISEKFRTHIARIAHVKKPSVDMMNVYGSADLGAMAFEHGVAAVLKKIMNTNSSVRKTLCTYSHRSPTVAQFVPEFINCEAPSGEIVLSSDNAVPLVRYSIGDRGGVFSFDEAVRSCSDYGVDLVSEANRAGVGTIPTLPFVYVYERNDFSTKLYGATIFPEHIRLALSHRDLVRFVTGKFTLETIHDSKHNQRLQIHVEMKPDMSASESLKVKISEYVIKNLLQFNEEYKNNFHSIPEKVSPIIQVWPAGDPTYFPLGIKQRWVKK